LLYSVGRFVPESSLLMRIDVYVLSPTFHLLQRIHARFDGGDWKLEDGYTISYLSESPFPVYKPFELKSHVIPEKPSGYRTLKVDEETMRHMRLRELRMYINRNKGCGFDTAGVVPGAAGPGLHPAGLRAIGQAGRAPNFIFLTLAGLLIMKKE
jgi:hypothetical protein